MKNLLICGVSGMAKEVLSIVKVLNGWAPRWNIVGFVDKCAGEKDVFCGLPIIGDDDIFDAISVPTDVLIAIADPLVKKRLYGRLSKNEHLSFPTIIHPSAIVDSSAVIGEGAIITAMCFVSVNVKIGKCVFMNVGSIIGHDSLIGDFCSIMPNADIYGDVQIGEGSLIGGGAAIHQGISIGKDSFVGMGSVVIKNVKDNGKVFGNPAIDAP